MTDAISLSVPEYAEKASVIKIARAVLLRRKCITIYYMRRAAKPQQHAEVLFICSAEPRGLCGDPRTFDDLTKVPQVFSKAGLDQRRTVPPGVPACPLCMYRNFSPTVPLAGSRSDEQTRSE